jgi:hypothetical protein
MFLFGKKKNSDDKKRLFQRWHEFTTNSCYDLNYIHSADTQMMASVVLPKFKTVDEQQQFIDTLEHDIDAYGLYLHHLSSTHKHHIIAVGLAEDEG